MKKIRVIQWTTGKVAKFSLRAILEDPRLELVGVYAYSQEKVGVDAGTLVDRPECGIKATNDIDELIALKADAVVYTPFMADFDHLVRLLENGVNVISTNLLSNLGGIYSDIRQPLEDACQRGKSSLYITGVHPGWANSLAVLATAVCRRVDSVMIDESADCTGYESAETWQALGLSFSEATDAMLETAQQALYSFRDTVYAMADALSYTLDGVEFYIDYARASETVDLGWFRMEKGTYAAVRAGWNGIAKGKTVLKTRVSWYLTDKLDTDWEFNEEPHRIIVEGDPGVDLRLHIVKPDYWTGAEGQMLTGLPAVSSVINIVNAAPGIIGIREAGIPDVPAGLWEGN